MFPYLFNRRHSIHGIHGFLSGYRVSGFQGWQPNNNSKGQCEVAELWAMEVVFKLCIKGNSQERCGMPSVASSSWLRHCHFELHKISCDPRWQCPGQLQRRHHCKEGPVTTVHFRTTGLEKPGVTFPLSHNSGHRQAAKLAYSTRLLKKKKRIAHLSSLENTWDTNITISVFII